MHSAAPPAPDSNAASRSPGLLAGALGLSLLLHVLLLAYTRPPGHASTASRPLQITVMAAAAPMKGTTTAAAVPTDPTHRFPAETAPADEPAHEIRRQAPPPTVPAANALQPVAVAGRARPTGIDTGTVRRHPPVQTPTRHGRQEARAPAAPVDRQRDGVQTPHGAPRSATLANPAAVAAHAPAATAGAVASASVPVTAGTGAGEASYGAPHRTAGRDGYTARLLARIDAFKRYPAAARLRRQEGAVEVSLRVSCDGRARGVAVAGGPVLLRRAAAAAVTRAQPLPVPQPCPRPVRFTMNFRLY